MIWTSLDSGNGTLFLFWQMELICNWRLCSHGSSTRTEYIQGFLAELHAITCMADLEVCVQFQSCKLSAITKTYKLNKVYDNDNVDEHISLLPIPSF
jgi:hypothetical protein